MNPFRSRARQAFLLVVAPMAAFMTFSVVHYLGGQDYDYHPGISVPVRVVDTR